MAFFICANQIFAREVARIREDRGWFIEAIDTTLRAFLWNGGLAMEQDKIFSGTVDSVSQQLTAIGGLMLAKNEDLELTHGEVNAIGGIINGLGRELQDWNSEDYWKQIRAKRAAGFCGV
jgi:hypothetical protein